MQAQEVEIGPLEMVENLINHLFRRVWELERKARPQNPTVESESPLLGRRETLQESKRARILQALKASGWVQKDAARMLGISPRAICYQVRILGIHHEGWRGPRKQETKTAGSPTGGGGALSTAPPATT